MNPAAAEIFDDFLGLMLRHRMLVPFKKKNLAHRIAHVFFWLKMRLFGKEKQVPEILIKGPGWKEPGGQSLDEVLKKDVKGA